LAAAPGLVGGVAVMGNPVLIALTCGSKLPHAKVYRAAQLVASTIVVTKRQDGWKNIFPKKLNLIWNAVKACEENGRGMVRVATALDGATGQALVTIEDNGRGIPPENIACSLVVFFAAEGAKGNGLGLSVTQKAIVEHGDTIDVESCPGRTTLTIRPPLQMNID